MQPDKVKVSKDFRFLVTLDNKDSKEGKRRTAKFGAEDLSSPTFEALVQKVTEQFHGCPNPSVYDMSLKYKGANDAWVTMKDTDDLVLAIKTSNDSLSIKAKSVQRAVRAVTPLEVPSGFVGNVVVPPPSLVTSGATVATPTVVVGAPAHVFHKKAVAKKGNKAKKAKQKGKAKPTKTKGNTSAAVFKICTAVRGDVQQGVLTAVAKFMILKIDNPLIEDISCLSGYMNVRSPGIKTAFATLKKKGMIEFSSGCIRLLPAGMDNAAVKAVLANQPSNNAQVQEQIKLFLQSNVNGKPAEIFNLVSDGEPHTIAELMQKTGYKNNRSPGFASALKLLNERRIIHYPTISKDIHKKTVQVTKEICYPFDDDQVTAV